MDQDLLEIVASAKRILPYLDLPLQHAQPRIIKRMGRRPPADDILAWIKQVRESVPGVRLRTTFIVGYPGETEADFQALLNFAAEARFDHLGAFPFWPEPGTRAAELEAQVPQETAQERLDRLMETQRDISLEINQGWLGKTVDLLVEGRHPESDLLLAGRTWFQAPEVDGSAIIRAGTGQPGLIQQAKVVEAHPYDLIVELTETAADTPGS